MRLGVLRTGHRLRNRLALRLMQLVSGVEAEDMARILMYRPAVFGAPFVRLLRSIMRGRSEWTPGERELFATFVSHTNSCHYCVGMHGAVASMLLEPPLAVHDMDRWRELGLAPRIAATLGLLEKLTLEPATVRPDDVEAVRGAGVSDAAIADAIHVAFAFNVANRLTSALGASFPSEEARLRQAAVLKRMGYAVPRLLMR